MNRQPDNQPYVRRVVLPSGKTIEVVVQLVCRLVVEACLLAELAELGEVDAALGLALRDERVEPGPGLLIDGHPTAGMAGSARP